MESRIERNFLIVVKNKGEGGRNPAEKTFEIPLRKNSYTLRIFRREKRQRFLPARCRLLHRHPRIIKEGPDICVALVKRIPQTGNLTVFEVTCNERGLAGTGRADDRDDGGIFPFVKEREQPPPRKDSGSTRTGYLRDGGMLLSDASPNYPMNSLPGGNR
jgi:hypothetical protein